MEPSPQPARISIRACRIPDYPRIVEMVRDLADHIGNRELATVTVKGLTAAAHAVGPTWRGIAAETVEGRLVGVCLYSIIFSTWRGMAGLYVIDLFVDPKERGAGIGHALLAAAARDGAATGCGFIRLEVDVANPQAAGFYERLGFTESLRNRTFTIAGDSFATLAGTA
jgi:ribosomal protein S18 acetylase RimI-like enzyme